MDIEQEGHRGERRGCHTDRCGHPAAWQMHNARPDVRLDFRRVRHHGIDDFVLGVVLGSRARASTPLERRGERPDCRECECHNTHERTALAEEVEGSWFEALELTAARSSIALAEELRREARAQSGRARPEAHREEQAQADEGPRRGAASSPGFRRRLGGGACSSRGGLLYRSGGPAERVPEEIEGHGG